MRVLRAIDAFMFSMYQRDWGAQPWAGAIYVTMLCGVMLMPSLALLGAVWATRL